MSLLAKGATCNKLTWRKWAEIHLKSLAIVQCVFTVRASETIALATDRLGKAHVTGLLVVDESEWPVGVFGQREALEAGDAQRSATVESAMNAAVLTLPDRTAIHNVARQARTMNARRIAVMNRHELVGIMTGIDFAKAIS